MIQANKIGLTINLFFDGNLFKLNFDSESEAIDNFNKIIEIKNNPTDDNLLKLNYIISPLMRKVLDNITDDFQLEVDINTNEIFLKNTNTPLPIELYNVIVDYKKNNYNLNSIINFWKLLLINPNKNIRDRLFDFINKHNFVLTDNGYMITYKAVYRKSLNDFSLNDFLSEQYSIKNKHLNNVYFNTATNEYNIYIHNIKLLNSDFILIGNLLDLYNLYINKQYYNDILNIVNDNYISIKKNHKSPKHYYLFKDISKNELFVLHANKAFSISNTLHAYLFEIKHFINSTNNYGNDIINPHILYNNTKIIDYNHTFFNDPNLICFGSIKFLHDLLFNSNHNLFDSSNFTDMYTKTMNISLGIPVSIPRIKCDDNPNTECSYGLHVGTHKYVENFAKKDSIILICLVNPANIVALPNYDNSKIRVSEYFPLAIADFNFDNKSIKYIDSPYLESDYLNYELNNLNSLLLDINNSNIDKSKYSYIGKYLDNVQDIDDLKLMINNRINSINI